MRQIKFRGQDRRNRKLVFGSLILPSSEVDFYPTIKCGFADYHEVITESVAQLVGFDRNNREVYEGDILIDELEQEHLAEIYDRPAFLATLTLLHNK